MNTENHRSSNVSQLAEYIVSRKWESVTSEMCRKKAKEFDENIKFNEYVELYKELMKRGMANEKNISVEELKMLQLKILDSIE